MTRAGVLTTLVSFDAANTGPYSELRAEERRHSVFGTTFARTVFQRSLPDGTVTTLTTFPAERSAGFVPFHSSLAEGSDGSLYGVTSHGEQDFDCGTIFKVSAGGVVSRLAVFDTSACHPTSQVFRGRDGFFYGAAFVGQNSSVTSPRVPFRFSAAGTWTIVSLSDLPQRVAARLDGTIYGISGGGAFGEAFIFRRASSLTLDAASLRFGATATGSGFAHRRTTKSCGWRRSEQGP